MDHLILGAGAAGLAALEAIRSVDPESGITLCAAEPGPPYTLCGLPDLLAGEVAEEVLHTTDPGHFQALGVDYRPGWQAVALEPSGDGQEGGADPGGAEQDGGSLGRGRVRFANGESLAYHQLLIATGSAPLLPPLPGLDRPGVFTRLDLAGCRALLASLPRATRATVIGGGFLGVEVAQALVERARREGRKLEVVMVEMEERILASMLDRERSAAALEVLEGLGVKVKLDARVRALAGQGAKGAVEGLECADGAYIKCDLAVQAVGVTPNVAWLEGSGVELGPIGGLAVNQWMATSLPGVFAAGDLVEAWDPHTGQRGLKPTWTNAAEQGRVAGLNMAMAARSAAEESRRLADAGTDPLVEYEGWDSYNVVHIGEVAFVSCGRVNGLPDSAWKVESPPGLRGWMGAPDNGGRASLYVNEGRLVGLCSVGLPPNVGHLHHLLQRGDKVASPEAARKLFYEPSLLARQKARPVGPGAKTALQQAEVAP